MFDGLFRGLLQNLNISGNSGNANWGFYGGDLDLSFGGDGDNFSWDTGNLFDGVNERRWEREQRRRDGGDGYDPYNERYAAERYSQQAAQGYAYGAPGGYDYPMMPLDARVPEARPGQGYDYGQRFEQPRGQSGQPVQYRQTGIDFSDVQDSLRVVDDVAAMQTMLTSLGYGAGGQSRYCRDPQTGEFVAFSPIDGELGRGTTAAFIDFAMRNNMDPRNRDQVLFALEQSAQGRDVNMDDVRAPNGGHLPAGTLLGRVS